jgi:FAD/FMN-containing dehydrogenase
MTILCDYEIKALCTDGMVPNYDEALINPASLDLRLGDTIMIESAEDLDMRPLSIAGATADHPYWLKPGQFILAQTIEVRGSRLAWQCAHTGAEKLTPATATAAVAWLEDWADGVFSHEPATSDQLQRHRSLQPAWQRDGLSGRLTHARHLGAIALNRCVALLMPLAPASGFETAG